MLNRIAIVLMLLCGGLSAGLAADRITATISVTNAPLGNTNTITINASTRTFTNSVTASPGTLIQQTNSIPWTATNLLDQITDYRVSQFHYLGQSASTNVRITGAVGEALTVTLAGGWGTVTYSTQAVSSPTAVVRVPLTVEFDTNRSRIASELVAGLSSYATNAFATNANALSNYITRGASPEQFVISPMFVSGSLRASGGVALTNGFTSALTNINPVSSNLVNYGDAIRSEGIGGNSLQIGSNAVSAGLRSVAIGNGAYATNDESLAIGYGAIATNKAVAVGTTAVAGQNALALGRQSSALYVSSTSLGNSATSIGGNSIAVGSGAQAGTNAIGIGQGSVADAESSIVIGTGAGVDPSAINSIAIGYQAAVTHSNSIVIGNGGSSTTTNEIVLGASTYRVHVAGLIEGATSTNATFKGTNVISGRVDYTSRANTGLANGNNAGVVLGTNVYLRCSGPSASYTINGISAEQDGSWHIVEFANPVNSLIIADNSGTDPTAANRIRTGTGADVTFTNNPVVLQFIYNASDSRWKIANWFR